MRYPPHITNPVRLEVAKSLLATELGKLLSMAQPLSPQIDRKILHRLIGMNVEVWAKDRPDFSIRDFWNGWHGVMMGFRLVPSLPWLTSLDVGWSYRHTYPVDAMAFGTILTELVPMGIKPTAIEAREWLFAPEQSEHLARIRSRVDSRAREISTDKPIPPVILQQHEGLAAAADGNNRLLRAIAIGQDTMPAFVGVAKYMPIHRPLFTEAWIPTSLLMDLIFQYRIHCEDPSSKNVLAAALALLVRHSTAGRYELVERAVNYRDMRDAELLAATRLLLPEELRWPERQ